MREDILEQSHSDCSPLVITPRFIYSNRCVVQRSDIPFFQSERAEWQAANFIMTHLTVFERGKRENGVGGMYK